MRGFMVLEYGSIANKSRRARPYSKCPALLPVSIFLILALAPLSHALFLASLSPDGNLSVLCEGQREIFVSSPDGSQAMQLDYAWQASFSPPISGPYTVQCGKEAKTVEVTLQPIARQAAPEDGSGLLILVLCCLFIICLFIAFLAIARHLNSGRTEFVKSIGRNKAKLLLRVGARLSQIEITDPVSMDFKGPPLIFSIGSLANGQEWAYEYETEGQALVLPASLSAISKEGKVSILSSLFSSDGKLFSPAQKGPGRTAERASTSGLPLKKERKKLPKL